LPICWWSKQESYDPRLRRLKSVPRFSGKYNQIQGQTKQLLNDTIFGEVLVSGATNHHSKAIMKTKFMIMNSELIWFVH
jgi:hypothetical protein